MNRMIAADEFKVPDRSDNASANPTLPLTATGLTYSAGGRTLVDVGQLDIRTGAPTIIMGPNGAGKSLLLRLLHGLIEPACGDIVWAGRRAGEAERSRQAMVFQRPVLLRRSVAANIDYSLKVHGIARGTRAGRVAAWMEKAGLEALARQPARTLSGGEQQRLALARALCTEPDVLFLDEPTASLDPVSTHAIETLIRDACARGAKIIMVTHDLGQAKRLAGEIIFMHRGGIVEQSPAKKFFSSPASGQASAFLAGGLVL